MRSLAFGYRVIFLASLLVVSAPAAETRRHFFPSSAVDAKAILPGPPADDSPTTKREVEIVLSLQALRTAADAARTEREGKWSPFLFDDVLGPWFTEQNLPETTALLDAAGRDTMAVGDAAKKLWFRSRPPAVDKCVQPSVGLPTNSSYPSGHGAYGIVLASLLSDLAPDLRGQLMARGKQIGDDRVLGGVHFPSDVEAGRALAPAILDRLRASPAFSANLEKAKEEFRLVRARFAPLKEKPRDPQRL